MPDLYTSNTWSVCDAQETDKPQIKTLFAEVFGHPMNEALWQWKYGAGRGMAVIAIRDAKVIAHYGGIEREVCIDGQRQLSVQCVDTMVKPNERGTLARKGPYFLVARAFLERYVGYRRRFEFGYGFPNKRVMRLGERVGIQASVGAILEPVWSPLTQAPLSDEPFNIDEPSHRENAETLFNDMTSALPNAIIGVRDANYLRYRYVDNPIHQYHLRLVTSNSDTKVIGILVLRRQAQQTLLLDLVAHPRHFPKLIDQARWWCGQLGGNELSAWISAAHLDYLGSKWGRLDDPQVRIPTSICTEGPKPDTLYDRWFLTAGDTEFK